MKLRTLKHRTVARVMPLVTWGNDGDFWSYRVRRPYGRQQVGLLVAARDRSSRFGRRPCTFEPLRPAAIHRHLFQRVEYIWPGPERTAANVRRMLHEQMHGMTFDEIRHFAGTP